MGDLDVSVLALLDGALPDLNDFHALLQGEEPCIHATIVITSYSQR